MMAIHLVTEVARFYIVTSRSFSFSVEFASLVNLDIYCFSLSFFPVVYPKLGAEAIYLVEYMRRLRCDKWHIPYSS